VLSRPTSFSSLTESEFTRVLNLHADPLTARPANASACRRDVGTLNDSENRSLSARATLAEDPSRVWTKTFPFRRREAVANLSQSLSGMAYR
jgi:hypothetical protein